MDVCLRLLKTLTIEENFQSNLPNTNQLLSKRQTMNGESIEDENIQGGERKEEVVIKVDALQNKDDKHLNEHFNLSLNSVEDDDNTLTSKRSKCKNSMESNHEFKAKSASLQSDPHSNPPTWSTSANFSDIICLGATVMIVTLLISVLIFYVFKDHEKEQ